MDHGLGHGPARQTNAGAKTPSAGASGFTLVEVLVALMILGITFGAVLGGMATSINTSDLHRQQAQVQAVLASAVEKVKSPETVRVACLTSLRQSDGLLEMLHRQHALPTLPALRSKVIRRGRK